MPVIEVKGLSKQFKVTKKDPGLKGALKNIFAAKRSILNAVDDISFNINKGEIVGFIGPNGAGKSTTIKMMCGILQPTTGKITINGLSPKNNRIEVVKNLGVVFGQRSQLYWDLRLGESFELLRRIYDIDKDIYNKNLDKLQEILDINEIINTPVRQLSLGQRMRGDLAAAILHSPPIIFLDEPTIGLDVEVKHSVRNFIKSINEEYATTIILTTHDLADIEQLCQRVMVINSGKLVKDGPLRELTDNYAPTRRLVADFFTEPEELLPIENTDIVKIEGARVWFEYEKSKTCAGEIINRLSERYNIRDIGFEETGIDDIIRQVYSDTTERDEDKVSV